MASSQEETVVVKKGKEETSVSTEEITALALAGPESNALKRGVVEISDDELEDLTASVTATASISPSEAGPSAPRVTAVPDTSGDWEFAHKLFVELNREAIGISGDGALVDLAQPWPSLNNNLRVQCVLLAKRAPRSHNLPSPPRWCSSTSIGRLRP